MLIDWGGGLRWLRCLALLLHRDSLHEGENREYFQLLGIVDLTLGNYKQTEAECWGSFKALYR